MNFQKILKFCILIFLCLNVFYFFYDFEFIEISGNSMEDSLFNKDVILIQKQLNHHYLKLLNNAKKNCYQKGNILVFKESPSDNVLIKRCVATEGDSILKINNILLLPFCPSYYPSQKFLCKIMLKDSIDINILEKDNIIPKSSLYHYLNNDLKIFKTNFKQFELLKKAFYVENICHIENKQKSQFIKIKSNHEWLNFIVTSTNFTNKNILEFKPEKLENTVIRLDRNFYFLLGDNLSRSRDSRHFGPIQKKDVLGKAILVLFNYQNGKFRWDRFLKRIE